MAFESIPTLDDDEFFKILLDNPQEISIVEVGDFLESDDVKNGYYFYITYVLNSTSQEKKISYNFKVNYDGKVVIGEVLNCILCYPIYQGLNMEILDVLKMILLMLSIVI